MGCCVSVQVAPYSTGIYIPCCNKSLEKYITKHTDYILYVLNKCNYALLKNNNISVMSIELEALFDPTLIKLSEIIIDEADFVKNYKLCCCLLNYSTYIMLRFYNELFCEKFSNKSSVLMRSFTIEDITKNIADRTPQTQTQSQTQTQNANEVIDKLVEEVQTTRNNFMEFAYDEPTSSMQSDVKRYITSIKNLDYIRNLVNQAEVIQNHPLLEWTVITLGDTPNDEEIMQLFCYFKRYTSMLDLFITSCNNSGRQVPQQYVRCKSAVSMQISNKNRYSLEYKKLHELLTNFLHMKIQKKSQKYEYSASNIATAKYPDKPVPITPTPTPKINFDQIEETVNTARSRENSYVV